MKNLIREWIMTLCAQDQEILNNIHVDSIVERILKFISELPTPPRIFFKFCLYLLEYSIFPLAPKIMPLRWLSLANRLKVLESWQNSSIYFKRIALKLIVGVCSPQIYSEPALLRYIGYGPTLNHRQHLKG